MRIKAVWMLVLALVLGAGPAMAGQYGAVRAGFYFPEESDFDNGMHLEAAFGMGLGDLAPGAVQGSPGLSRVNLEAAIGYYESDDDRHWNNGNYDYEYSVVPLLVRGIFNAPLEGTPVSFYGGAGLGLYIVNSEVRFRNPGILIKEDETDLEFGVHALGGVSIDITDRAAFLAELRGDLVSDSIFDVGGGFLNFGLRLGF